MIKRYDLTRIGKALNKREGKPLPDLLLKFMVMYCKALDDAKINYDIVKSDHSIMSIYNSDFRYCVYDVETEKQILSIYHNNRSGARPYEHLEAMITTDRTSKYDDPVIFTKMDMTFNGNMERFIYRAVECHLADKKKYVKKIIRQLRREVW